MLYQLQRGKDGSDDGRDGRGQCPKFRPAHLPYSERHGWVGGPPFFAFMSGVFGNVPVFGLAVFFIA